MTTIAKSSKGDLAKNTGILAVGKFTSQIIVFLMLPLYTSFLSPDEYGIVDVVLTYVVLLAPALTLQMEMAVFRFLIEAREREAEKTRIISNALQIIVVLLIFVLAFAMLVQLFVEVPYFWFILGIIFTTVISGFCLQAARGLGKNSNFAIASIFSGVVTVSSNFSLLVIFGLGAPGLLISMVLAQFASALYLIFSLRLYRYVSFSARDWALKKTLLKYSTPLVPNGISWWVINAADRTIILLILGLTSNGIYAIASKFPLIYSAIFSVFGMSWTESASININEKNRDQFFSSIFDSAFRFFGAMGLGIIAALPFIFPLLVNEQYEEAYIYVPAMIVGALFNSIVGLYSAIYVAKKMTGKVANTSIAAAIISVTINLIFVQLIGLFAAALANVAAFLSMAIYRHYDLKTYVNITYKKSLLIFLAALYVIVIISYYLNYLYLNVFTLFAVMLISYFLNRGAIAILRDNLVVRLRGFRNSRVVADHG